MLSLQQMHETRTLKQNSVVSFIPDIILWPCQQVKGTFVHSVNIVRAIWVLLPVNLNFPKTFRGTEGF